MKVRTTTLAAGPGGVIPSGTEMDLPEGVAREWIEGGHAVALETASSSRAIPVETAESEAGEETVTRGRKRKAPAPT